MAWRQLRVWPRFFSFERRKDRFLLVPALYCVKVVQMTNQRIFKTVLRCKSNGFCWAFHNRCDVKSRKHCYEMQQNVSTKIRNNIGTHEIKLFYCLFRIRDTKLLHRDTTKGMISKDYKEKYSLLAGATCSCLFTCVHGILHIDETNICIE